MKKTPLKRYAPLRAKERSFSYKPDHPRVKAALRRMSDSPSAIAKRNIQDLLRELAIVRDKGCVLRHFPEAGACGGYRMDGELILQAEHLITRANSISYGDMRNIVLLCRHHHLDWKPQYSRLYWTLIHRHIGPERVAWLDRVEAEEKAKKANRFYLADWQKLEVALRAELAQALAARERAIRLVPAR